MNIRLHIRSPSKVGYALMVQSDLLQTVVFEFQLKRENILNVWKILL